MTDEDIHKLSIENATAIKALTKTIDGVGQTVQELARAMREEDKEIKQAVTELVKSQQECKYQAKLVEAQFKNKKELLDDTRVKLATKASKEEVKSLRAFIHKALWWLFGSMVATIGFLLQQTVFKGN